MPKFMVELWVDGYDSEENMEKACEEFIYEQLNMTASSVKITKIIKRRPYLNSILLFLHTCYLETPRKKQR